MSSSQEFSWQPPVLETERLLLRPITENDAPAMFQYTCSPNVARYTLWSAHKTVEDSVQFIRKVVLSNYSKKIPEPWGITLKSNPAVMMGTVGCLWASEAQQCMELGYALAEPLWGQGIVVEAARPILDFIFNNFQVERIQARCKVDNKASARVMEKLGMQFEGTHKSALFHREKFWDMHLYAVLRSNWKK